MKVSIVYIAKKLGEKKMLCRYVSVVSYEISIFPADDAC